MPKPARVYVWLSTLGRRLRSTTAQLTLSYLSVIMLMSIGFSVVFYNATSHELGRQVPPRSAYNIENGQDVLHPRTGSDVLNNGEQVRHFFEQRIAEGRHTLTIRLLWVNLLALVSGVALSYYLARRTLEPIEDNMAAQAQFVSDASHELRTPLAALQTTNEVALRASKLSSAEVRRLLADNVEEVQKLKTLTDGLLKLARQDNGAVRLGPTDLQAVVSGAMTAVVVPAQAKRIAVQDAVPVMRVMADATSLSQALVALLDNAIKYSPADTAVTISASAQKTRGARMALLTISDQGQGIAARDQPHIFDRFYRADQSRNKQRAEGYGIGLAIVKKTIEHHHGQISVDSKQGKGTSFTIRLPLA